jgi:serine/threonine protein kinase
MNAPGDRATLPAGARLGDFEVARLLGAGSFGAVYEATHLAFGRRVALKVLDARYANHPEALARFDREAEANAALAHPNIVGVLAVGEAEGSRYLALECLDGETLAARLTAGALPLASVVDLCGPLVSALALVHRRGYVHRDLKPGNIFLARRGHVEEAVLLDFGVVQVQTGVGDVRLTRRGALLGSPAYMSPEQARSLPIDARSDQFSLGAILWECLVGRRLFTGTAVWEVLEAVRRAEVPPILEARPGVPPVLAAAVHRLLALRSDDRFPSMNDFGAELSRVGSPTPGTPPQPPRATELADVPEAVTTPLSPARDERAAERAAALLRVHSMVLQRYRLDGLLGVGGVAAVYAATDLTSGEVVALKLLHPTLARDRTASARFLRESRVTRALAHPAIPRWIASGSDPVHGQVIVMGYVDGVDLATAIDQGGALPIPDALRLGARAAEALECAHAAGVIHRDVKPENLLLAGGLTSSDALRLVDFGLAFCVDATRLTLMQSVEGSACYLAPEQIEHGAISPATDLYALGATLVTMLTGAPPFEGQYLEQLSAHVKAPPPSLRKRRAELPEVVERYVLRLLEKDPRRRPTSAAEVARRLAEMAEWFDPAASSAPAPAAPTAPGDGATGLIEEIRRASERLRQVREGSAAAHARVVEQLVEFTSRRLHREALRQEIDAGPSAATARVVLEAKLLSLGDAQREAQREAALEAALDRMAAQSQREQRDLLATLDALERRLAALR